MAIKKKAVKKRSVATAKKRARKVTAVKKVGEKTERSVLRKRKAEAVRYACAIRHKQKTYLYTGRGVIFDDDVSKAVLGTKALMERIAEPLRGHYAGSGMRIKVIRVPSVKKKK